MYAEQWRKLAWATILGKLTIFLAQLMCEALRNSCLLEYATVLRIKNTFTGHFDFLC